MRSKAIALSTILLMLSVLVAGESKIMKTTGWVSDSMCAAHGDKKCSNREHLKQGAKLVIVADKDNKIWMVQNAPEFEHFQGQHIRFSAVATDQNTLRVKSAAKIEEAKR